MRLIEVSLVHLRCCICDEGRLHLRLMCVLIRRNRLVDDAMVVEKGESSYVETGFTGVFALF